MTKMTSTEYLSKHYPNILEEYIRATTPNYLEIDIWYIVLRNNESVQYKGYNVTPRGKHFIFRSGHGIGFTENDVFKKIRRIDESVKFHKNDKNLMEYKVIEYDNKDPKWTGHYKLILGDVFPTMIWQIIGTEK